MRRSFPRTVHHAKDYVFRQSFTLGLAIVLSGLAAAPAFAQFTDIGATLTGVAASSVAWGDYDNDGALDILLTGRGPTAKIYRNNGAGAFTDIGAGLTGVLFSSAAWGDYNNDGNLDILLTGDTGAAFVAKVYRNNGNGTFTDIGANLPGVSAAAVAWGDYDNDGSLDILLTGATATGDVVATVYRNNLDDTFTDIRPRLTGVFSGSVAWADYDKDGAVDILLTGSTATGSAVAVVYHNDGNGEFTDIEAGLTGVRNGSVASGDYDNDGALDILLTGITETGSFAAEVYRNNGDGTFTEIGAGLTGVGNSSVAWGDYDNDGEPDILLTGETAAGGFAAKVYRNDGGGTFTDIGVGLTGVSHGSVAWGDYDNDGALDILLSGFTGGADTARIYRNAAGVGNTPPTAPTNLSWHFDFTEDPLGVLTLEWDEATDVETPSAGLTYNVFVGHRPIVAANQTLVSPMANLTTGFRRVVKLGASNGTSWALTHATLDRPGAFVGSGFGVFFLRVQAVDAAFAGSPFSEETAFAFGGAPQPRAGITAARNVLASLSTAGSKKIDHEIDESLKHLDKGLLAKLWVDGTRLGKHGEEAFNEHREAVQHLLHANTPSLEPQITQIVMADAALAQAAYADAIARHGRAGNIKKALAAWQDAAAAQAAGRYDQAIEAYEKAWSSALKA